MATVSCSVEGCDQSRRKRDWCASHYAQWYRSGEVKPFAYKWAERATVCAVCGLPTGDSRFRRFCSGACDFLWRKYDGHVPTETPCVACGTAIDLTARGKRGQRIKASIKFCRPCKQDYRKYKLSTRELADRDGTDCGICREPVDMNLRRSVSNMCASVDHVLPRSLGGTHDPENLQLAHLYCNQVKSDRVQGPALIGGGSYE
jgi:5-methylcytosine-specific restriction endonuclease McrA